jgi:translation elongation factor EF-Tu-like GTPase
VKDDGPLSFLVVATQVVAGRPETYLFGTIERGQVRVGDVLDLVHGSASRRFECSGVEFVDYVSAKEALVALQFRGIRPEDVSPGDRVVGPERRREGP